MWTIIFKVPKSFIHHIKALLHLFDVFVEFLNNEKDVKKDKSTRWCMRERWIMKSLIITTRIIHSMKGRFVNNIVSNSIDGFFFKDIYIVIPEYICDDIVKWKDEIIFQGYFICYKNRSTKSNGISWKMEYEIDIEFSSNLSCAPLSP